MSRAPFDFDPTQGGFFTTGSWFDLPALVIVAILTIVLVIGIRESSRFNNLMVVIKVAVVLLVIAGGVFGLDCVNGRPCGPFGPAGSSIRGRSKLRHRQAPLRVR